MKKHYLFLIFLLISLFLESCGPPYYLIHNQEQVISGHNYQSGNLPFRMRSSDLSAPMFSEKGQFTLELSAGYGAGLSLAWAATHKIGIYAKGSLQLASSSSVSTDTFIYQVNYDDGWSDTMNRLLDITSANSLFQPFLETGVCIYKCYPAKNLRLDFQSGFAYGSATNKYHLSALPGSIDVQEVRSYIQLFTQGNIGIEKKHWELILLNRLAYYNFIDQKIDAYDAVTYNAQRSALSLQEGLRLGVGGGLCKVFLQYEVAIPLFGDVKWYTNNIKGGLTFRFGDQWRRKK